MILKYQESMKYCIEEH